MQEVLFIANVKKPFTLKSVMNKPQAEGRVNHVCTVERRRRSSTLFSKRNYSEAQLLVYLKSFLLISMVELDQRSAAKTLANKM